MNLQKILAFSAMIAVFLILFSSQTNGDKSDEINSAVKQKEPLHLREPLVELSTRLKAALKFNIFTLISVIGEIGQECLLPPGLSTLATLMSIIDFKSMQSDLQEIEPIFTFTEKQEETFCNSSAFRLIHEHVWVNDTSARDLVEFFYYNEFPEAYDTIRGLYEAKGCPADLIATLPTGPDPTLKTKTYSTSSDIRDELKKAGNGERFFPFLQQQNENCTITEILKRIQTTGVFELLLFIDSFVNQFTSQPSLHFMVGKIQEDTKRDSFRKFRLLQPVRMIFDQLHQLIISDETINTILTNIKNDTGIDLLNVNIVETVVTIFETIMWQNSDPIPPYNLDQPAVYEEEYEVFY